MREPGPRLVKTHGSGADKGLMKHIHSTGLSELRGEIGLKLNRTTLSHTFARV